MGWNDITASRAGGMTLNQVYASSYFMARTLFCSSAESYGERSMRDDCRNWPLISARAPAGIRPHGRREGIYGPNAGHTPQSSNLASASCVAAIFFAFRV
jgi:hypothetical protein